MIENERLIIEYIRDILKQLNRIEARLNYIESNLSNTTVTPQTDCYKCKDFWNCDGQCDEMPQIEDDTPQAERSKR